MKVIHTHLRNVQIPELCHRESEILCGLIPKASIAEMLLSEFVFYSSPRVHVPVEGTLFIWATLFDGGLQASLACVLRRLSAGELLVEKKL